MTAATILDRQKPSWRPSRALAREGAGGRGRRLASRSSAASWRGRLSEPPSFASNAVRPASTPSKPSLSFAMMSHKPRMSASFCASDSAARSGSSILAFMHDPAVRDMDDLFCLLGKRQIVRHEHERRALAPIDAQQLVQDLAFSVLVQIGGRLVRE